MHTLTLRKVGGSVMLELPLAILELLDLKAGNPVAVAVDGGRLVIEPRVKPRYTLKELLAQCNSKAKITKQQQREWLNAEPVGRELI
jgi:antitoxin ChpS